MVFTIYTSLAEGDAGVSVAVHACDKGFQLFEGPGVEMAHSSMPHG